MSNFTPLFYMDAIPYPCLKANASLPNPRYQKTLVAHFTNMD